MFADPSTDRSGSPRPNITVAAVCLLDDDRVLTVRKRNTSAFMLPGGKPEPGESTADTAVREVGEELGILLHHADLTLMGTWATDAANEPDTDLASTVYRARWTGTPVAAREIQELRWVPLSIDPDRSPVRLAPLLVAVLPRLRGIGTV